MIVVRIMDMEMIISWRIVKFYKRVEDTGIEADNKVLKRMLVIAELILLNLVNLVCLLQLLNILNNLTLFHNHHLSNHLNYNLHYH